MTERPDPFEQIEKEIRDLETKASERPQDPLVHLYLGAAYFRKYRQGHGHEDNVAADCALHHLHMILDDADSAATLRPQAALLSGQLLCYEGRYGECLNMIERGQAELSGATNAPPDVAPELELVGGVALSRQARETLSVGDAERGLEVTWQASDRLLKLRRQATPKMSRILESWARWGLNHLRPVLSWLARSLLESRRPHVIYLLEQTQKRLARAGLAFSNDLNGLLMWARATDADDRGQMAQALDCYGKAIDYLLTSQGLTPRPPRKDPRDEWELRLEQLRKLGLPLGEGWKDVSDVLCQITRSVALIWLNAEENLDLAALALTIADGLKPAVEAQAWQARNACLRAMAFQLQALWLSDTAKRRELGLKALAEVDRAIALAPTLQVPHRQRIWIAEEILASESPAGPHRSETCTEAGFPEDPDAALPEIVTSHDVTPRLLEAVHRLAHRAQPETLLRLLQKPEIIREVRFVRPLVLAGGKTASLGLLDRLNEMERLRTFPSDAVPALKRARNRLKADLTEKLEARRDAARNGRHEQALARAHKVIEEEATRLENWIAATKGALDDKSPETLDHLLKEQRRLPAASRAAVERACKARPDLGKETLAELSRIHSSFLTKLQKQLEEFQRSVEETRRWSREAPLCLRLKRLSAALYTLMEQLTVETLDLAALNRIETELDAIKAELNAFSEEERCAVGDSWQKVRQELEETRPTAAERRESVRKAVLCAWLLRVQEVEDKLAALSGVERPRCADLEAWEKTLETLERVLAESCLLRIGADIEEEVRKARQRARTISSQEKALRERFSLEARAAYASVVDEIGLLRDKLQSLHGTSDIQDYEALRRKLSRATETRDAYRLEGFDDEFAQILKLIDSGQAYAEALRGAETAEARRYLEAVGGFVGTLEMIDGDSAKLEAAREVFNDIKGRFQVELAAELARVEGILRAAEQRQKEREEAARRRRSYEEALATAQVGIAESRFLEALSAAEQAWELELGGEAAKKIVVETANRICDPWLGVEIGDERSRLILRQEVPDHALGSWVRALAAVLKVADLDGAEVVSLGFSREEASFQELKLVLVLLANGYTLSTTATTFLWLRADITCGTDLNQEDIAETVAQLEKGGVLELIRTGDLPLRLACAPGHAWTVRGRAGTGVTIQDRVALTVRSWHSLRKSSIRMFRGTDVTRIPLTQALQDLGLENEPDQLDFLAAAMEKAATSGPELLFRWQGRAGGKDRFVPALLYEHEASDLAVVTVLNGDGVVEFVDLLPVSDAPGRLLTRLLAVSFSELRNLVREAGRMARATEIFFLLAAWNFHGHAATLDAGDLVALQPRGGNWEASSWKPGHGSRFAPLGRIATEDYAALRQETHRFYDLHPMIEAYEAARLRRAGQSRELFPSERREAGRTLSLLGGLSLSSRKK